MIGVAITTTPERPEFLAAALEAWARVGPDVLVVINDREHVGVAHSKNRCLSALMRAGCDHLVLTDDDCRPTVADPLTPYVTDPMPHLMWCWGRKRLLGDDGHHTTWGHPRGVMLYVERHVVETVGGMRTEFGRGGSEHVEWSRRIHQAGFTPAPYMDLKVSPRLWHAEDMGRPGESNGELAARRRGHTTIGKYEAWEKRLEIMDRYDGVVDFVDYR